MKRFLAIIIVTSLLSLSMAISTAHAYWVWTPETKKFINPKYAVKDTPKEQYNWAMDFYDSKDYKRAAIEFEKLVKNYEYSEYAAKAQYRVGLSYENQGKYYIAFENYQKTIDNFPHVDNMEEIIARQFNIGNIYASKENPRILGTNIMTSYDRAIEIYKKVVDNAPFGKLSDQAQFKMAETMKDAGRFDEAAIAFQKIIEDYPDSPLQEKARFEMANAAYKASLQPAYDQAPTDKALKAFEDLTGMAADKGLTKEAEETIKRLKDKAAEKSFNTAEFYERIKRYDSAIVYYKDVMVRWPDSSCAETANIRINDLQIGNYSHKKNFDPSRKGGAFAWFGKDKKPKAEAVLQPAIASETKEAPKKKKSWFYCPWGGKKKQAPQVAEEQVQAVAGEVSAPPVEAVGRRPSWWTLGMGRKEQVRPRPAPAVEKEPAKAWTLFGAGKKRVKGVARPRAAVSTEPAASGSAAESAKPGWWTLGMGKRTQSGSDVCGQAESKKAPAPVNF